MEQKFHSKTAILRVRMPDGKIREAVRIGSIYYDSQTMVPIKIAEDLGEVPDPRVDASKIEASNL